LRVFKVFFVKKPRY